MIIVGRKDSFNRGDPSRHRRDRPVAANGAGQHEREPHPSSPARACRLPCCLLGLALLVLLGAAPAAAQAVSSLNQPVVPFRITQQGGEIGTQFDYLGETEKVDGQSVSLSNTSFEEYILYRMKAYVYHPRFLDIDASVKLGLLQQVLKNNGLGDEADFSHGTSNTFLAGYNLYLSFFKEHPLSFSIWANHDREPVMELFTDRLITDNQGYGATLHWKKGPLPMDLAVGQSRIREWGFSSRSDSTIQTLDYAIHNAVGNWMNTELRYHFQDYTDTFSAKDDFVDFKHRVELRSHDLNFLNTIYLDPGRRSSLSTNLRMFTQSGTNSYDTYYGQERLLLQHSKNLRTYYTASYMQNRLPEDTINSYHGEAGLDHKLFDSLQEHLDLHWRQSDFSGGSDTEYGPTGRLGYRKQTPWGVLSAGYAHTIEQVDHQGSGQRPIRQEAVTMHAGMNNFLSLPAVVDSSIAVNDGKGLVTYDEGFDYDLIHEGNRTALRLRSTGRLTDGQVVHVDYDVEFSDVRYISDDQDFNVNYDFARYLSGLNVFYRWHNLSALNAPQDDVTILQFTEDVTGMAYRWRWLTWREEYDVYHSNFSSYNQLLSQLEGLHAINSRLRLGWHVGATMTDYQDTDLPPEQRYDNAIFAGTALRGSIRANGYWEVAAEARKESGQLDETLLGFLGKLGMRWRKTRMEGGVRVEDRKRFDDQRNRASVFLQFSREF